MNKVRYYFTIDIPNIMKEEGVPSWMVSKYDYEKLEKAFKEALDLIAWLNLGQDVQIATDFLKENDNE